MQNKYILFLTMFDALSSHEREPQILSKIDKIALVFRISALSSIQVNIKTLKEIAVILRHR
jgi:hypothetical protein